MNHPIQVNGKPVFAELALPTGESGPGVLVLHAWWGLKPYFRTLCSRLAKQGFVAFAPDLNNGEVAQTVADAEALRNRQDSRLAGDIIIASKDFLLSHPACTGRKIGVIGFSMGAAWSLFLASSAPEQVAATVLFYGVNEVDFTKIRSKVLGHFSDVDEWEPFDGVQGIEKAMSAAGVDVTFHVYPGLGHWFVEDDRPEFDPKAAKLAWDRTFAFLKANL
jgi:carboxymethylenebutenolidase